MTERDSLALGDIVETIKGAKFWGEIIAFDNDEALPGCMVRAIDPGFLGCKHVYPLKQLRRRPQPVSPELPLGVEGEFRPVITVNEEAGVTPLCPNWKRQGSEMKLTEAQRNVLKLIAEGEFLSFGYMATISELERRGFIEEVKTGFISQVHLRITDAGRASLSGDRPKEDRDV